jgi:MSHA pilin protein MshD
MCSKRQYELRQRGMTLIELVIFIVVISVGLMGILGVLNLTTRNSANPMLLKQQVAIAESLLEEIESKPFTYCDPGDATVTTATGAFVGAGGCTATLQGIVPTTVTESRYNQGDPYDNVGDYGGFAMNSGIIDPTNTPIPALANYSATVAISQVGTTAPTNVGALAAALRIDVTIATPGQPNFTLTGYRLRYAPNSP